MDEEHEQLGDCGGEFQVLWGVLTARVSSENQPNQQRDNEDSISKLRETCAGTTIATIRLAGLMVMCVTGSWGRDPAEVGKCAGIVTFHDSRQEHLSERVCAGWPGTYSLAYGKGNGDVFGVTEIDEGKVSVRAVIPLPLSVSQYSSVSGQTLRYCQVL